MRFAGWHYVNMTTGLGADGVEGDTERHVGNCECAQSVALQIRSGGPKVFRGFICITNYKISAVSVFQWL